MKRKGFTLIELLGVIIVLAIIALIAVPTILGVIDKARKGALKDSAYGLIEAANLYYAQYGVSNTERFNLEEENELKYKGKVEKGTVLLNSKGKVMICINDNGNAAYKNYNDNEVVVVSGKTCNVNSSETQVLLDGEKTIDEYTNQELTDLVNSLQEQIDELKNDKTDNTRTDTLEQTINTKADTTLITNLSNQHTTDINRIDNNILSMSNKIGSSNISSIGDGTITGAINSLSEVKKADLIFTDNVIPVGAGNYVLKSANQIRIHLAFTSNVQFKGGEGAIIATIPEEYRMSRSFAKHVTISDGVTAILNIDIDGNVKLTYAVGEVNTGSWIFIDETIIY